MEDGINSGMHMPESICNDRYHPTKEEDNTFKKCALSLFRFFGHAKKKT